MCLTIKDNQPSLRRQVVCQFAGKRHIPFVATDHEKRPGRDTIWMLRAKEAPPHIQEKRPGSAWTGEVIADTTTRTSETGGRAPPGGRSPAPPPRTPPTGGPAPRFSFLLPIRRRGVVR